MDDFFVSAAAEVGYACACTVGGTDGSAVGGEGADTCLLMDGGEIGEDKGTKKFLLAGIKLLCVLDYRHRAGDALISAAGIDDDRLFAAVHSGVGACGSPCLGAVADIVAVDSQ